MNCTYCGGLTSRCYYIRHFFDSVEISCCWGGYIEGAIFLDSQGELFTNRSEVIYRSKVKRLNIKSNSINGARSEFLIDRLFENIHELDYSFANSPNLYTSLKFRYLKKFNASHGILTSLSKQNFEGQSNLREINFSYNFISVLDEGTFDQNIKLSTINLSYNMLPKVDRKSFSKLIELKVLDLSFNQIEAIDEVAFENNEKLELLKLEMNPLKRFDCKTFSSLTAMNLFTATLDDIVELDLSCAFCSFKPSPDSDEFIIGLFIDENILHLGIKHLASLRHFNVAGKQYLDVSKISSLLGPLLESLDLSSSYLGELKADTFERFKKLESLKLSDTNLSFSDVNPFCHQTDLKVLDISYNNLTSVNITQLDGTLQNLVELNIAGSQIPSVWQLLQMLSPSIQSLDLSYMNSPWNYTDDKTFQRFTNLRSLNLSHTGLVNFQFETFYHLSKLESLDISYNNLEDVDFSLFVRNFNNLRVLNLGGNRLTTIDSITKSIFPKLVTLGLFNNQFYCWYMASFLEHWPHLTLISNPTNKTRIDGTDCMMRNPYDWK